MTVEAAPPNFRELAIQCLADEAAHYPPAGWAAEFDATHASIPAWALDGNKPNELFRQAARRGKSPASSNGAAVPTYAAQLWNQVATWLRANPEAPEIAPKVSEIAATWHDRHQYPEDWLQYQRMIDADAAEDDPQPHA